MLLKTDKQSIKYSKQITINVTNELNVCEFNSIQLVTKIGISRKDIIMILNKRIFASQISCLWKTIIFVNNICSYWAAVNLFCWSMLGLFCNVQLVDMPCFITKGFSENKSDPPLVCIIWTSSLSSLFSLSCHTPLYFFFYFLFL